MLLLIFNTLFMLVVVFYPHGVHNKEKENEKYDIKILGLFGPEDDEERFVFQNAVEEANSDLRRTRWRLSADIIFLETYDSFYLSKLLCEKLDEPPSGYAAIFGPDHNEITNIVRSITSVKKIPHIDTRWDTSYANMSDIYINLFPESASLAKAINDILQDMDWETFTLIYESPESLINLQKVLKKKLGRSSYDRPFVVMKELPESVQDYRPFLKAIKNSSETHIMLHCAPERIADILEEAKEVDLMGPYQNFFLTSLDAHIVIYEQIHTASKLLNSQANITTLRVINPKNEEVIETLRKWYSKSKFEPNEKRILIKPETIKTDTALMRDAVILFTQALKDMPKNFTTEAIQCEDPFSKWNSGHDIMEKMKSIEFDGLTGEMEYEQNGKRKYFALEIIEATKEDFRSLGLWDPIRGVKHYRNISQIQEESSLSIANKTLRVVSKIVSPYLELVSNESIGNDRYRGFCKELMDELAASLKFNYVIEVPPNSETGEYNKETGRYTGLIGELRELRADLAICDFTITPERSKAVDFTAPFMSLGISILYTESPAKETSYFSFLDPFDYTVWIYVVTAYLALSLVKYVIARCSPSEWESAHPCEEEPEELENAWDLKTCLWFGLGTLLQQGCDILPKGISTRLTASMWWFFTLIITSTYTANLAAFLTTQRMDSPIKNVEDLANQDKVKYGCLQKGATSDFFRNSNDSLYQRMWATMESANPPLFTETNEKGVERVINSRHKYAFFMESSSIEYQINSKCGLTQIGGLLDSKFYGIAVPTGSVYKGALTNGILALKENSKLDEIKMKWWNPETKGNCEVVELDEEDKDKLGIANVGGVFLLLILGCIFAFFVAILEFLWNVRKVAVREKITLSEAFWLELKFAFRCHKSTKPIRYTPSNGIGMGTPLSVSQIGFINRNI